jgi:hypothetical protein
MGLRVRCMPLDWQLSCMAKIWDNLATIFTDVQDLHIDASLPLPRNQNDMDPLPLLELFRSFMNVKRLFVADNVAHYVGHALKHEVATAVLPKAKVIGKPHSTPSRHAGRPTVKRSLRLAAIPAAGSPPTTPPTTPGAIRSMTSAARPAARPVAPLRSLNPD